MFFWIFYRILNIMFKHYLKNEELGALNKWYKARKDFL